MSAILVKIFLDYFRWNIWEQVADLMSFIDKVVFLAFSLTALYWKHNAYLNEFTEILVFKPSDVNIYLLLVTYTQLHDTFQ